MVRIKVRIFSQAIPDQSEIELEDGSSVETLLMRVKQEVIQKDWVVNSKKFRFLNNPSILIVLLNGVSIYSLSGWKTVLNGGDEVSLLPMVAGG